MTYRHYRIYAFRMRAYALAGGAKEVNVLTAAIGVLEEVAHLTLCLSRAGERVEYL